MLGEVEPARTLIDKRAEKLFAHAQGEIVAGFGCLAVAEEVADEVEEGQADVGVRVGQDVGFLA